MVEILENPAVRSLASRMSVEQYHRFSEAGIVPERTELLRGIVVDKMSKSPLHVLIVRLLTEWLTQRESNDRHVRKEEPLTFTDSEPEPDVAVVKGRAEDYRFAHPTTAEFIIEVAISSLELDREKGNIYAEAGVPEFWIVLPQEQAIEVYTSPSVEGYQQMRRHEDADAPLISSIFPELSLTPRELFA